MRRLKLLLILALLSSSIEAEPIVLEHQGRPAVEFKLDGFELVGSRSRSQTVHSLQGQGSNGSKIGVQVRMKSWLGEDKALKEYNSLRALRRSDPHSRLVEEPEVPGALKAVWFRKSDPYDAEVLVLFRNELRCELMVTGPEALPAEREETLTQIKRSVRLFGPATPLKIEGDSKAEPSTQLRLNGPEKRDEQGD